MPTGYTVDVQDGKITKFPEFALQCARAFGALIDMRDEPMDAPIPAEFKPSTYNERALTTAKARLAKLQAMKPATAIKEAKKAHAKLTAANRACEARQHQSRKRYEAMLAKVNKWAPPTADHEGLKKFMAEQLAESIRFDCSGSTELARRPLSGRAWLAAEIALAQRDITYHTAKHAEEVERVNGRTKWVKQLRASLSKSR